MSSVPKMMVNLSPPATDTTRADLVGFFNREVEPKALCRNCEYFDGGGLTREGNPVSAFGDCLNTASPFFTTDARNTCRHFFPCSTRWPEADHE